MTDAFEKAAEDVQNLKQSPTNDELLELYALYKQATVGDINTEKPGMFQLKNKAKWEAWNGKKNMSTDEAKEAYIALVENVLTNQGDSVRNNGHLRIDLLH